MEKNSIDLIYIDPPFNTNRDFYNFSDKFNTNNDYLNFINERVLLAHSILKNTGTFVFHISPCVSHYIKVLLDKIFGIGNFRNEIIWKTNCNIKNKYKLGRTHDVLLVYTKTKKFIFNPEYHTYSDSYIKRSNVKICDFYKKQYITTALHNNQPEITPRPNLVYQWNGNIKQWYCSIDRMEILHYTNRLIYNTNGIPRIKRFLDEMDGIPVKDLWDDIASIQKDEKVKYATQKPIKLLDRIVKMYSNENDTVLDFFAGTGTTGISCIKNKRNYILVDINENGKEFFELKKMNLL